MRTKIRKRDDCTLAYIPRLFDDLFKDKEPVLVIKAGKKVPGHIISHSGKKYVLIEKKYSDLFKDGEEIEVVTLSSARS